METAGTVREWEDVMIDEYPARDCRLIRGVACCACTAPAGKTQVVASTGSEA